MRGWRGYFGFCETPDVLIQLTRWVRLRLRVALWRQWKTPRRRRAGMLLRRPIKKSDIILDPMVLHYEKSFENWTNDAPELICETHTL
jgi:hypothetical protein